MRNEWILAVGLISLATFAIRFSFFLMRGRLPHVLEVAVRMIPAAALAALAFPPVLRWVPGSGSLDWPRILAAAVALGVAARFQNMFWTVVAGMGSLWVLRPLLG